MMSIPTLSLAVSRSDRTRELILNPNVSKELTFELKNTNVEQIFEKQVTDACFDVAELSLSSYLIGKDKGDQRLIALPVFLSRAFRHNAIYVRRNSTFTHPMELKGKKIGLPEFQMTAAVWIRAYFRHEWGVPTEEINWYTYRPERIPIETPAKRADTDNIFTSLLEGEVDAIMTARRPPENLFSLNGEEGGLRRIFTNPWEEERAYFNRTNVFPIMHLLSVKSEIVEENPKLARTLYELFSLLKERALSESFETVKNDTSLPFLWESAEASTKFFGNNIWPYGVKNNWKQIETFMNYLQEDYLISKSFTKEDLFAPTAIDT